MVLKHYYDIIKENNFPLFQMGTYNNVHIFNNSSFKPISKFLKRFSFPDIDYPIEPKEMWKYTIQLLLYLLPTLHKSPTYNGLIISKKDHCSTVVLTNFHLYLQNTTDSMPCRVQDYPTTSSFTNEMFFFFFNDPSIVS